LLIGKFNLAPNPDQLTRSCKHLSARAIAQPNVVLAFDKDDDDTLDFVVATSNLRAIAYGIPKKTRFEVKGELTKSDHVVRV
jgi:ubiquitin-like 1-activating enzyme E1 B